MGPRRMLLWGAIFILSNVCVISFTRTNNRMLTSLRPLVGGDSRSPLFPRQIRRPLRTTTSSAMTLMMFPTTSINYLVNPTTIRAVALLVGSAAVGRMAERKILPDSGILVTLLTAAAVGQMGIVPRQHALYDSCWSTFLPGSLALLLLAIRQPEPSTSAAADSNDTIRSAIARVALPFVLASLASLAGCVLSFFIVAKWWTLIAPSGAAAAATACQAASFVGGSVNFFATAAHIQKEQSLLSHQIAPLLSSMATADLIVTAIFFAILSWALQSKLLRRWYNGDKDDNSRSTAKTKLNGSLENNDTVEISLSEEPQSDAANDRFSLASNLTSGVAISGLAWGIVHLATILEKCVSSWIPGTACGFITILAPLTRKWLKRLLPTSKSWLRLELVARPLSGFYFLLLFASIGVSADLSAALVSGPACLLLSLNALVVHLLGTLGTTLLASRLLPLSSKLQMELEDVLVASNAAIGGPATAAAFCGRLSRSRQRTLTYAATVWGVVGYAIGTTLGISFFRTIQRFIA